MTRARNSAAPACIRVVGAQVVCPDCKSSVLRAWVMTFYVFGLAFAQCPLCEVGSPRRAWRRCDRNGQLRPVRWPSDLALR